MSNPISVYDPITRKVISYYNPCPTCTPAGMCKGHHPDADAPPTTPPNHTLEELIDRTGSLRRLLLAYWHNELWPMAELRIEAEIKPETLAMYKPSDYR